MVTTMSNLMPKGKDISKTLINGAIFSTFKYTDPHNVHGRSTIKDGKVIERVFRYGLFRELKIAKKLNDLARSYYNQTRNQMSYQ